MPGAQPPTPSHAQYLQAELSPAQAISNLGQIAFFLGVFDPLLAWVGFTSGLIPWGWAGQAARPGGQRRDLSTEGWRRKTQSGKKNTNSLWEELAVQDWCC